MKKRINIINGNVSIPAIIWGEPGTKVLIEIHGNMSDKEDKIISIMAKRAVEKGYQVISFDLPKHGERSEKDYALTPANCISDLHTVYNYAKSSGVEISIFACSIGAYFSLQAYNEYNIKQSLFLSPVVNMEKIIKNMMLGFNVSEEKLKTEKQIKLPIGETLDWDYYTFVCENPIKFAWKIPTYILYGANDTICNREDLLKFSNKYEAIIKEDANGEHFYHTKEHLETFDKWIKEVLL